jgi:hypothetical protein
MRSTLGPVTHAVMGAGDAPTMAVRARICSQDDAERAQIVRLAEGDELPELLALRDARARAQLRRARDAWVYHRG